MSEKVLNTGINFFATILVARYLGPEQFGILAYAISFVALFAIVGHVGLSGMVVRELVKYPDTNEEIMGTSFALKGVGSLVGIVLLLVFIFLTEEYKSTEFWILIILMFSLLPQPFDVVDFWYQSRLEAKYTAISKILALVVSAGLKVSLVFVGANVILFSLANVIQAVFGAALLVLFYRFKSRLSLKNWKFSLTRAKYLLSQGWMVFLGSIFAVIYLKVDQVMLKWLVGAEDVGVYAVAATISEAWYFVPAAIVTSFFPKLIKLRDAGPSIYHKRLQQIFDLLFMLALVVAATITFIAQPLIIVMFGEAYQQAAPILVIHIWAALFIFMRAVLSKWILIEHVLMFSLITQGMGALANVALNYWLIPIYGGEGAAYATLISYATASYLALVLYSKTRLIFWMMTKSIFSPIRYVIAPLLKTKT